MNLYSYDGQATNESVELVPALAVGEATGQSDAIAGLITRQHENFV